MPSSARTGGAPGATTLAIGETIPRGGGTQLPTGVCAPDVTLPITPTAPGGATAHMMGGT